MKNSAMQYHKIDSVFKRDPETKHKRFLMWDYSRPEFEYLQDCLWTGTEKVDGTNIRLYKDGSIKGRTDNAQIYTGLYDHLLNVSARLVAADLPEDTVLYGEGYGAKVQSGGHYIPDGQSFVLFDVMIAGNMQPRENVKGIAEKLGIKAVPVLGHFTLPEWVEQIKAGEWAESCLHAGAKNEGVVLRPTVELQDRTGRRIITKIKFKDF